MNSHLVPDFQADMEEDCSIPTTSGFSRPKKPTTGEEEIMELLWHNGQVVIQSQNRQGPSKNKHPLDPTVEDPHPRINGHDQSNNNNHQNLFMQENEMATWLQHYPVLDDPIDPNPFEYADLLYTAAPPLPPPSLQPPPPPPPASARQNFAHFSRVKRDHPYNSNTVVESNETPNVVVMEKTMTNNVVEKDDNNVTRELTGGTCEMTVTSSSPVRSGASTYSASGDQARVHAEESVGVVMANEDKKRKAKDQNECHSQDVEVEASEARKQARSSSTKRSRAAEVHNLSERRRRDRINEKMRALQELIPRCNKSDKASMLDEAIEYLKSLQMQVQMMSMGCGMVPMMYPGMQQYLPAMQMGMGMDMAMTRPPMVPYPTSVLPPGSSIPNPAATISAQQPHNMGPRFPIVQFHMPQTGPPPVADPSGVQTPTNATRQVQNPTHPRMPNFVDPYQQFLGMHQAGQLQFPQPGAINKASTSKDVGNTENQQNG